MLELRGIVPRHERPAPDGGPGGFSLVGRDGVRRTTRLHATPEPRTGGDGGLVFDLDLEPRGGIDVTLDFEVSEHGDGELAAAYPAPARARGGHARHLGRPALQPHPAAIARRPRAAALRAGRPVLLRRGAALVRDPVRPRQPDHRLRDAVVRARRRGGDAAAPRRAARHRGRRRARRGARQGAPRAARRRAGHARRDALRPLLRQRRRHAPVPVPARALRRLVRQPRPVPRAARAGGGRPGWIDRYARPRRRRTGRVHAPLRARAPDAGLEGLGGRHPGRRRRAARATRRARGGAGLRGACQADHGPDVRARRRRRARRAPARGGRAGRGRARPLLARGRRLLRDRAGRGQAAGLGSDVEPGASALGGRREPRAGAGASATC